MEEEKKYIYNDKAERIKKMNRFYIGATIFLGILFLLYLWLRMANQNLVNATVYGKCNSIWEYCINNRRISFEHDYLS